MKSNEQLIQEIREEFTDVPFPSHCGLHAAVAKDDWISDESTLREITNQKDYFGNWWDVPRNHLRQCMTALSYLDAAGLEFYLPAYMVAVVEAPELFDIPRIRSSSWQVLYTMCPPGEEDQEGGGGEMLQHFYDRFSKIRDGKKHACRDFLQYLAGCTSYCGHAREIAEEALTHEFWSVSDAGFT